MHAYMNSLRLLLDRDDEIYWPTHGPAIKDTKTFVKAFIAHREEREASIVAQIKEGRVLIKDMVPVIYAAVDKRLYPAAARSVFAHVLGMIEDGRIAVDGEPRMDSALRLT